MVKLLLQESLNSYRLYRFAGINKTIVFIILVTDEIITALNRMFGRWPTDSVTELKQRCDSVRLLFIILVTEGIVMDIREQVREQVNSYKTKHKQGFTREEYMKLLENYPGINMDRFSDALNGITCMRIDGETVVFPHDIELAIRCGMEDRGPTTMEWD